MTGAIQAFVGTNGGGKTLAAVELGAIPAWNAGKVVVANFRVRVPGFKRLRSWRELVRLGKQLVEDVEDPWYGWPYYLGDRADKVHPADALNLTLPPCDGDLAPVMFDRPLYSLTENRPVCLILDEMTACLPSRSFASTPLQLQQVLNQLRKARVQLIWTAPNWARAEVLVREVTKSVTVCHGNFPDQWERDHTNGPAIRPPKLLGEDGKPIRVEDPDWAPNRRFVWTTYDASEFDEFSVDESRKLNPIRTRRYWRPRHRAHLLYDTYEHVSLLDHLDDIGNCMVCDGTRPRHKCSCPKPEHNPRKDARASDPGLGAAGRVAATT